MNELKSRVSGFMHFPPKKLTQFLKVCLKPPIKSTHSGDSSNPVAPTKYKSGMWSAECGKTHSAFFIERFGPGAFDFLFDSTIPFHDSVFHLHSLFLKTSKILLLQLQWPKPSASGAQLVTNAKGEMRNVRCMHSGKMDIFAGRS